MKRWMAILFLGMFLGNAVAVERYYLSVCAIFQNEAPYLKEWIEYNRLMGVEHFYLYNNRSTDGFLEVLAPYLARGIAELKNWPPYPVDESKEQTLKEWRVYQPSAYNDCIEHCDTEWLAIIDIDEFILPVKHRNLALFLSQFDANPMIGGIRVNWQVYGTSGLSNIPAGKLLIESLLWKAVSNYEKNVYVKSIVRPSAVERMFAHAAEYKPGFTSWPEGNGPHQEPLHIAEIRINHYWTRAEDFFFSIKADRLKQRNDAPYQQTLEKTLIDYNQVYDPIMLKIVPWLKKALQISLN